MEEKVLILGQGEGEKLLKKLLEKDKRKIFLDDLSVGEKPLKWVEKAQVLLPDLVIIIDEKYIKAGISDLLFLHGLLCLSPSAKASIIIKEYNVPESDNILRISGLASNSEILIHTEKDCNIQEINKIKQELSQNILSFFNDNNLEYFGFFNAHIALINSKYFLTHFNLGLKDNSFLNSLANLKEDIYPLLFLLAKNESVNLNHWQQKLLKANNVLERGNYAFV